MFCPHCGSDNVNVQLVTEQTLVKKKHSAVFWVLIGWWWCPFWFMVKWLFLTPIAFVCALFHIGGKKRQIKNVHKSMAVCNSCGHAWEIKEPVEKPIEEAIEGSVGEPIEESIEGSVTDDNLIEGKEE